MEQKNKITIGIDASPVARDFISGTERYTREIIKAISNIDHVREYILYTPKKLPEDFVGELGENFNEKVIPMKRMWTQGRLAFEMMFGGPDMLFVPAHALPLIHPKKTITVIHDVGFKKYPENYTRFNYWYLDFSTDYALRRATKIITPSEATKKEILKFYPFADPAKIVVIPLGLTKMTDPALQNIVPSPFILYVGRFEVRKNIFKILGAFENIKPRFPSLKLVCSGKVGVGGEHFIQKTKNSKYSQDIIILTNVSEQELATLYKNAEMLVFPSLYEGFGLPILEAFSAELPVVTSNTTSTAEVASDSALLVNPLNTDEIAGGIAELLSNQRLADDLRQKGLERVKNYTWKKSATKVIDVFNEVLSGQPRHGRDPAVAE